MDTLRGNVFLSTLDMAQGYYQIEVDPHDGLKNCPSTIWQSNTEMEKHKALLTVSQEYQQRNHIVIAMMLGKM